MTGKDQPIYISKPSARSIGQEYRLYADRIELDLHLLGRVRVSLDEIDCCVRPPIVIGDLFRGAYPFKSMIRAFKVDMSDLFEHVALVRHKPRFWAQLRITVDDPQAFVAACEDAKMARAADD